MSARRGRAHLPAAGPGRAARAASSAGPCCRPPRSSRSRLVGYTVWIAGPAGPLLCLALAAVLVVLYRTYFLFLRQHADLTRMYSFGRQVTGVGIVRPTTGAASSSRSATSSTPRSACCG